MICLEFEAAFVPDILDGRKRLTLRRNDGRNLPDRGEMIALISGANVIGIARVFDVRLLGITIRPDGAAVPLLDGYQFQDEDEFARLDGFEDEWKMGAWYADHYRIAAGGTMALAAIEYALEERRMPW